MKTDLSYVSMDQASRILDYRVVPESREERLELIRIMRYTKVKGAYKNLSRTPDDQLRRVAQNLLKDAEKKTRQYWSKIDQEVASEEFQDHYHAHLCDLFNIPEEKRDSYTINELEQQLLQ
ncbi:MAG: hypothetical protein AABX31_01690 [Nanoarchaeota archaeon]